jgi:hypothetical protein
MRIRLKFLLLLCTLPFLSSAQNKYVSGTVVTQAGDTLKGLIQDKRWGRNPGKISFKVNETASAQTFQATEVQSFNVSGQYYRGAIVEVDRSSSITNNLEYNGEPNLRKDTTFLRILFDGPKTLYHYKDSYSKDHFFISNNGTPEYLVYKRFRKKASNDGSQTAEVIRGRPNPNDTREKILENKKYITQLLNYLGDCASITDKLQDLEYTQTDLANLFTHYYKCSANSYTLNTFKNRLKKQRHFDLILGVAITNLSFNSGIFEYEYLEDLDFGITYSPAFGIAHTTTYPSHFGRWQFRKELLFSSYEYEDDFQDFVSDDVYTDYQHHVRVFSTRLSMILRYNLNIGTFRPFFSAGLNLDFSSVTNERIIEEKLVTIERTTTRPAIPSFQPGGFSSQFGIGLEKGRWGFVANYRWSGDVSGTTRLTGDLDQFNLLVTFRLKKPEGF